MERLDVFIVQTKILHHVAGCLLAVLARYGNGIPGKARVLTIASWWTELNQIAMISPIIRAGVHGFLRGDVSISHCMQSTCVILLIYSL